MKKSYLRTVFGVFACALILTGCHGGYRTEEERTTAYETQRTGETKDTQMQTEPDDTNTETDTKVVDSVTKPKIVDADWAKYFDGQNGAAVLYDASAGKYMIYNRELAETRRSPCSTFKIISSLVALENGIIKPEDSTRAWSGEVFWNEDWNRDIDFREAFRASCVWYYRQVVDDIGADRMQKELDKLSYGNCDISDWIGQLNTNNNNRSLTGFWIESSLKISPKEQVEVMERIFDENSDYSVETRNELKQVMLVSERKKTDIPVYGKTGMGKDNGIVVDAWFTGFAESAEGTIYFCVYLGRSDNANVSSQLAKELAIQIVSDYCSEQLGTISKNVKK